MMNINSFCLVGFSVFMFNTAFAADNRVVEITTIYKDSLIQGSIEACPHSSPLLILGVIAVSVEQLIPDKAKEKVKFKTSFYDIERKYEKRSAFVGEYEVLGIKNPLNYKVVFSVANPKSKEYFRVENISGSLVDTLKKSQTELISGVCKSVQELNPKSVVSTRNEQDEALLTFVKGNYPDDLKTQKYIYNKQLAAKKYMETVSDDEVKKIAYREYPSDYSTQKYIYNKQLAAKEYMATVINSSAKSKAIKEYPKDFVTQKYTYGRSSK